MAAQKQKIFQICPRCKGTKVVNVTLTTPSPDDFEPGVTEIECPICLGEGHIEWGYVLVPASS